MRIDKRTLTALHKLAAEDLVAMCAEFGHQPSHSRVCKEQMDLCNNVCEILRHSGVREAKFVKVKKFLAYNGTECENVEIDIEEELGKKGIDLMVEEKIKYVWAVKCMICETTVDLPLDEFMVTSTDQCAEFIRTPHFTCGKCHSACLVELQEAKKLKIEN